MKVRVKRKGQPIAAADPFAKERKECPAFGQLDNHAGECIVCATEDPALHRRCEAQAKEANTMKVKVKTATKVAVPAKAVKGAKTTTKAAAPVAKKGPSKSECLKELVALGKYTKAQVVEMVQKKCGGSEASTRSMISHGMNDKYKDLLGKVIKVTKEGKLHF